MWVYPPDEFLQHVSDLVCFVPEDHPDNEFFDKAFPLLPLDINVVVMILSPHEERLGIIDNATMKIL